MSQFDPRQPPSPGGVNTGDVLLAAASISASTAISVTNFDGTGIYAYMNVVSGMPPGSASVTIALKIKSIPPNATASAVTIASTPVVSATGTVVLCMYPGAAAGSGSAAALVTTCGRPLPRDFQVVASISSGAASFGCVVSLGMHVIR